MESEVEYTASPPPYTPPASDPYYMNYWRSSRSVSSSSSWADIISTSRISTLPATSTVSSTISTVSGGNWTTTGWVSSAAGIRNSTIRRSTATSTTTAAATSAAGGLGQCRTSAASSYCARSPVVRRKHGLRVPRLVALQLAVWTHRFHTGRLVYLFTTTCTLATFDHWYVVVTCSCSG